MDGIAVDLRIAYQDRQGNVFVPHEDDGRLMLLRGDKELGISNLSSTDRLALQAARTELYDQMLRTQGFSVPETNQLAEIGLPLTTQDI